MCASKFQRWCNTNNVTAGVGGAINGHFMSADLIYITLVVGQDVVQHLQAAITRRGDVRIEVCAILNDTTGCLMSSAWRDDRCRVGLILGI